MTGFITHNCLAQPYRQLLKTSIISRILNVICSVQLLQKKGYVSGIVMIIKFHILEEILMNRTPGGQRTVANYLHRQMLYAMDM